MENPPSDKDKFRQALEAYAVAKATGNSILIQSSSMLVEQWLTRLPESFPALETTKFVKPAEPANSEPGGMP